MTTDLAALTVEQLLEDLRAAENVSVLEAGSKPTFLS